MTDQRYDHWLTRHPPKESRRAGKAPKKAKEQKTKERRTGGTRMAVIAGIFLAVATLGLICYQWLGDRQRSNRSVPSSSVPVGSPARQPVAADSVHVPEKLPPGLQAG